MFFPFPTGIFCMDRGGKLYKSCYNPKLSLEYAYYGGGDGDRRVDLVKDIINGRQMKIPKIVKGEKLPYGFTEFLSNHGKTAHLVRFQKGVFGEVQNVDFSFLEGKYLLICCFNVPMPAHLAEECRAIIEAYDELSASDIPFEMVVVPMMRSDVLYDQHDAFYHFCSAFSCLGIPFSDFETLAYLRCCITGRHCSPCDSAILVHPNGTVLQDCATLRHFFYYGSEWFPFLDTTLDDIAVKDELLRSNLDPLLPYTKSIVNQDLSLAEDILQCHPSLKLTRFDGASQTLQYLSSKYVGLYLCFNGSIMEQIKAAHDNCLKENLQLEIVLVCMPLYDDLYAYYRCLFSTLEFLNIKSWFLFHYNSNVSRRLWRMSTYGILGRGEKLIIIPPGCKSGELCGGEIITNFGIKEYPFTRTAILRRRLEYVKSLTPLFPSLFNRSCLIHNGQEFKSEQLQGKKVLLYLSWGARYLDTLLFKYYPKITDEGWEVVFVPLKYTPRYWNGKLVDRFVSPAPHLDLDMMPWPYMPPSAAQKACIKEKLFFPEDRDTGYLFAVDNNGNIVSRYVGYRLASGGVTESLFDDYLERDLARVLSRMPFLEN